MIRTVVFLPILLTLSALSAESALELRAYSDGPRLKRDEPWPEKSAVYDEAKKEIRLCGARNEVLGFQIYLKSKTGTIGGVNIQAADLAGESGKPALPAKNIEFFHEWFTRVETPSRSGDKLYSRGVGEYPDPLVPLSAPKFGAPFDLAEGRSEVLFGDLYIPHATPAGTYRGALTLTSGAGALASLTLSVTVWNFTLPEETHFKNTMAYEREFIRWGFRNPSPDDELKIEEDLFKLAHRHRINPGGDCSMRSTDEAWEEFCKRYGKYFSGAAFTESPGKGTPLYLWRVGFGNPQADDATLKTQVKATVDFFSKKGWMDSIVLGGPDEPKPGQYAQIGKLAKLVREASGGKLKYFLPGAGPQDVYKDFIDIWDGCWTEKDFTWQAERRKAGQKIWYAGGFGAPANPCMDSDPYGNRSWPWVGWKYNFEGFEMWHAVYWVDKFNQIYSLPDGQRDDVNHNPEKYLNVWKNPAPLTFDEGHRRGGKRWKEDILQNGSTSIFYPGYDIGLPKQCVASIKAKDYRRGAQDYEYLWLLDKAGEKKAIDAALAKICVSDSAVTLDEGVWESVRQELGKRLDSIGEKK
jgi:hypothetical protein